MPLDFLNIFIYLPLLTTLSVAQMYNIEKEIRKLNKLALCGLFNSPFKKNECNVQDISFTT
jgi:hypothetical protein